MPRTPRSFHGAWPGPLRDPFRAMVPPESRRWPSGQPGGWRGQRRAAGRRRAAGAAEGGGGSGGRRGQRRAAGAAEGGGGGGGRRGQRRAAGAAEGGGGGGGRRGQRRAAGAAEGAGGYLTGCFGKSLVQSQCGPRPDGLVGSRAPGQDRRARGCAGCFAGGPALLWRRGGGPDPALRLHRPQRRAAGLRPPPHPPRPGALRYLGVPGGRGVPAVPAGLPAALRPARLVRRSRRGLPG